MIPIENITIENFNKFCEENSILSNSQMRQDLFVLFVTNKKQNGYFVEFGACDGIELSNTLVLEKEFNWNGILSEPCVFWINDLKQNRKCIIDERAVWVEDDKPLLFNQIEHIQTLSNIDILNPNDWANPIRNEDKNIKYEVQSVTLETMLKEHNAPKMIDYMSIDTEGSEYEIIKKFDFSKYNIQIINIEHNGTDKQNMIYELLTNKGYKRVLEDDHIHVSQDDWYIKL
jgi:FkbM family methyltransferase